MNAADKLEAADFLDRSHDEILVRGWTKFVLCDASGRVCAIGALIAADCGNPLSDARFSRPAAGAFGSLIQYLGGCIVSWNNAPERTIDDVLDTFRNASKQLREEAGQQ